jgi:phenylpyruvate tautomerase PptA (4-oxalocrotonate tautomerase family)
MDPVRLMKSPEPKNDVESLVGGNRLTRRTVLKTATVAAGAVSGAASALGETTPAAGYGAPLVEVHVPAGALTAEQKGALIKGITNVVLGATNLPADQSKKFWVQIFETAEAGWGVGGQVFVPKGKT